MHGCKLKPNKFKAEICHKIFIVRVLSIGHKLRKKVLDSLSFEIKIGFPEIIL